MPEPLRPPTEVAAALCGAVTSVIRGKDEVVRLALSALLGGGHLMVEDVPGTGKTLLGKSIAAAIDGTFRRVQCTPDLLPTDITGTSVFQPADGRWDFREGPLFANVVLVDEINRASPRTQAALLEPMEEHQVSVDGSTRALPDPFFCIATQNPFGQIGTFPLPESQLDRFALVLSLGLPDRDAEREIVTGVAGADVLGRLQPVTQPGELRSVIAAIRSIYCAPSIVEYLLDLAAATRSHPDLATGASPRASSSLLHVARAHATVCGREYVTPDDIQAVFGAGSAHRVGVHGGVDPRAVWSTLAAILHQVPVPRS